MERLLFIGDDARTHALVWKFQHPDRELYCTPGNPGIAKIAHILPYKTEDLDGITHWAAKSQNRPNLTIVGPENPLVSGIVDKFQLENLNIFFQ